MLEAHIPSKYNHHMALLLWYPKHKTILLYCQKELSKKYVISGLIRYDIGKDIIKEK